MFRNVCFQENDFKNDRVISDRDSAELLQPGVQFRLHTSRLPYRRRRHCRLYVKLTFLFFKFEYWLNVIYYLNSVDGVGYAPSYQGKTLYGQITNPGFVPLPSFNPYYPAMYRQQEQTPNGFVYSYGYPTPLALEDLLPVRQTEAPTCGAGPTAMPTRRELTSERIAGGTSAKKNAWPFIVS
jgi:hypothetical protein